MVKFTSAFFVFATLALSVFASPIEQSDVNKVKGELRQLAHDVVTFNEVISGTHAPVSISEALTLRSNVVSIGKEIGQTTDDVKRVPNVSLTDASAIMSEVEKFIPTIVTALKNFKNKKDDLRSIPIDGALHMVQRLLKDLDTQSSGLADALIDASPSSLKARAMKDKDIVQEEFKDVINYYEN